MAVRGLPPHGFFLAIGITVEALNRRGMDAVKSATGCRPEARHGRKPAKYSH
jgi:hypothetical protein